MTSDESNTKCNHFLHSSFVIRSFVILLTGDWFRGELLRVDFWFRRFERTRHNVFEPYLKREPINVMVEAPPRREADCLMNQSRDAVPAVGRDRHSIESHPQ